MPNQFSGVALGSLAIGSVFIYGGLTGKSPLQATQAIIKGKAPNTVAQTTPIGLDPANQGTMTDTSTPGGIGNASGGIGADAIIAFFKGHNIPKHQIAGALGNIQVESDFDPSIINPSEGAIGYCQWEGGRRAALQRYAAQHGGKESDSDIQIGFMWAELHGSEIAAYTLWRATTTASQAAAVWDSAYERSRGTSRNERIANANAWMSKL